MPSAPLSTSFLFAPPAAATAAAAAAATPLLQWLACPAARPEIERTMEKQTQLRVRPPAEWFVFMEALIVWWD